MGEESRLAIATFKDGGAREEPDLVIRLRAKICIMQIPCAVLEVRVKAIMRTDPNSR